MNNIENKMTVKQLIDALSKLDPDAKVVFNINQSNCRNKLQLNIPSTTHRDNYEFWVAGTFGGCGIDLHLPDGAYIAGLPKTR